MLRSLIVPGGDTEARAVGVCEGMGSDFVGSTVQTLTLPPIIKTPLGGRALPAGDPVLLWVSPPASARKGAVAGIQVTARTRGGGVTVQGCEGIHLGPQTTP